MTKYLYENTDGLTWWCREGFHDDCPKVIRKNKDAPLEPCRCDCGHGANVKGEETWKGRQEALPL